MKKQIINNLTHHCNKKNKKLGINFPKETKDLLSENYKTLMKEIKMIQINGEICHVLGLEPSI